MENLWFCLMGVGIVSSIIGWFLSLEFSKRKAIDKINNLNNLINQKEDYYKNLKMECEKRQNQLDRIVDESIICKERLLQTSNLLRKKSDELFKIQEKLNNIKIDNSIKPKNETEELQRLRTIIIKKDKIIDNMRREYHKAISRKKSLYIEISKDQFNQIEQRLKEYKEKIETLEQENNRLNLANQKQKEFDFIEKLNYSMSNIKDIAVANLFGNNYEKIPKT
jgi:chromosome segregation ATPase